MGRFYSRGFGFQNVALIIAGIILICVPPFILLPIIGVGLIILGFSSRGIFRR